MNNEQDKIRGTKPIPISAAKAIANKYGYEQVMIFARKTGQDGMEHMTTYGVNPIHCKVMARIAEFLQTKIMGWETK